MTKGGKRSGAGRPEGSGKFGEPTRAMRIPVSAIAAVQHCLINQFYRIPFYQCAVAAGFPSPAENDQEERLNLNELLIKHPAATFFLRVSGSSMIGAGIHHGDILIVDRSLEPVHGKIVIASLNGELTVKRLCLVGKKVTLVAENGEYPPIDITEEIDFRIWGIVTNVIHSV